MVTLRATHVSLHPLAAGRCSSWYTTPRDAAS